MDITITLSADAITGWQYHLNKVVNLARDAANLSPHTLQSFFQEAEEMAGVQHFNMKRKHEQWETLKITSGLTDADLLRLAQMMQQRR